MTVIITVIQRNKALHEGFRCFHDGSNGNQHLQCRDSMSMQLLCQLIQHEHVDHTVKATSGQ